VGFLVPAWPPLIRDVRSVVKTPQRHPVGLPRAERVVPPAHGGQPTDQRRPQRAGPSVARHPQDRDTVVSAGGGEVPGAECEPVLGLERDLPRPGQHAGSGGDGGVREGHQAQPQQPRPREQGDHDDQQDQPPNDHGCGVDDIEWVMRCRVARRLRGALLNLGGFPYLFLRQGQATRTTTLRLRF
jgi:hypothetical protein